VTAVGHDAHVVRDFLAARELATAAETGSDYITQDRAPP
jgi:hypothetical protein